MSKRCLLLFLKQFYNVKFKYVRLPHSIYLVSKKRKKKDQIIGFTISILFYAIILFSYVSVFGEIKKLHILFRRSIQDRNLVCIIVPTHTIYISEREKKNLINNFNVLNKYDKYIIVPEKFKEQSHEHFSFLNHFFFNIIHVENFYFKKFPKSYNILMTRCFLYQLFRSYKFVLICQTDCVICYDSLEYWCKQDYDYIGAPWLDFEVKVGNGGLSLRREESLINYCCRSNVRVTKKWEDKIFAYAKEIKKPDIYNASLFSIETYPLYHLNATKHIPFGFHKPYFYNIYDAVIAVFGNDQNRIKCNVNLLY